MNIFVGNLSFTATEKDVKSLFEAFGVVSSINLKKKAGDNSRAFGTVVMPDDSEAQAAIAGLAEKEFMGRPLNISVERPKPVKPKKDYKEIKRLRQEAKKTVPVVEFDAPEIPEKEIKPKAIKVVEKEIKPRRKIRDEDKKISQPPGSQTWVKRIGRGTAKPWKKKPGGVHKKFRHSR
jgi:RNA recognition motif-containing protein